MTLTRKNMARLWPGEMFREQERGFEAVLDETLCKNGRSNALHYIVSFLWTAL